MKTSDILLAIVAALSGFSSLTDIFIISVSSRAFTSTFLDKSLTEYFKFKLSIV